mmetsp:Transcript_32223/g.77964  ORF Transcript_32223/g.77964 Transcript_32223/m.77964 type:complete len:347 (+) Transcript_32223:2559-3599(+)
MERCHERSGGHGWIRHARDIRALRTSQVRPRYRDQVPTPPCHPRRARRHGGYHQRRSRRAPLQRLQGCQGAHQGRSRGAVQVLGHGRLRPRDVQERRPVLLLRRHDHHCGRRCHRDAHQLVRPGTDRRQEGLQDLEQGHRRRWQERRSPVVLLLRHYRLDLDQGQECQGPASRQRQGHEGGSVSALPRGAHAVHEAHQGRRGEDDGHVRECPQLWITRRRAQDVLPLCRPHRTELRHGTHDGLRGRMARKPEHLDAHVLQILPPAPAWKALRSILHGDVGWRHASLYGSRCLRPFAHGVLLLHRLLGLQGPVGGRPRIPRASQRFHRRVPQHLEADVHGAKPLHHE